MKYTTKGKLQSLLDNLQTPDNNVILVDSGIGSDSNSGKDSWNNALATWDAAYAKCTENNGDIILLAPGHAETWSTTGTKVTGDKAGVMVIALGVGQNKATITVTHTGATAIFSSNNQAVKGVRFVSGVDSITKFITVSGNDCDIDIESVDITDIEVITDVINTGDRNKIKVKKQGFITGDANDCVVSCNGCDGADIEVIGDITDNVTAIVEFVTAASSNVNIKLRTLVNGITDLSQNVVDTITGSTYNVSGFDKGAGATFSGNENGVAVDDVGAVATALAVVDTNVDAIKAVTDYETLVSTKSISSVANGNTNLFDLTGEVEIESIIGVVTTATEDAVCTYKFDFYDGTTATDLCTATSIQNKAVGTQLAIDGTFANALAVTTGNVNQGQERKIILSDGGDTGNGKIRGVSSAAITGVVTFTVKYKKLSSDGALSASA